MAGHMVYAAHMECGLKYKKMCTFLVRFFLGGEGVWGEIEKETASGKTSIFTTSLFTLLSRQY